MTQKLLLCILGTFLVVSNALPAKRSRYIQTPISTTLAPFQEYLKDPGFAAFLTNLHKQYEQLQQPEQQQQQLETTTTAAPEEDFLKTSGPSVSRVFVGVPSLKTSKTTNKPIISTTTVPTVPHIKVNLPGNNLSNKDLELIRRQFEEEKFKESANNAQYSFASDVEDTISGNSHQREETRDGLSVKGKYSYNDGFYKRTVEYEADDKGYRVVGETIEAVGEGPEFNPNGHARVETNIDGSNVKYQITQEDINTSAKHNGVIFQEADDSEEN